MVSIAKKWPRITLEKTGSSPERGIVRIAAAQLDRAPNSHKEGLALVEGLLVKAREADLLVLPELALCGYADPERVRRRAVHVENEFIAQIQSLARNAGKGIIFGYAEKAGNVLYNAALAIGPDGVMKGNYRKVNLWGDYEKGLFAPGSPSPVMPWGSLNLGMLICYDLEFPDATRDLVLRGVDTLIVISATGLLYDVVPQHLVPARAYESGCHVIYSNWAGVDGELAFVGSSCITAPDGAVRVRAPVHGAAVVEATVSADEVSSWRLHHDYVSDRRRGLYRWD